MPKQFVDADRRGLLLYAVDRSPAHGPDQLTALTETNPNFNWRRNLREVGMDDLDQLFRRIHLARTGFAVKRQ